ncbi:MAG: alginate export family protein [Myxococcota bacterium]
MMIAILVFGLQLGSPQDANVGPRTQATGAQREPADSNNEAATQASDGSSTSNVAAGLPLELGAHLFGRYENRQGYDRLAVSRGRFLEGDSTVYRARLVLTSAPIDLGTGLSTRFRFAPQAAGFFGNLTNTTETADLGLYEGWLRLEGTSWLVDAGRLRLNYGDALVIGDLDWNQVGRSFDGLRSRLDLNSAGWIDLIVTQVRDGIGGPGDDSFAGDIFFGGVYASLGTLIDEDLQLEPYVLSQLWGEERVNDSTAPAAAQLTAGVRAVRDFGPVDVRLEPGIQFGQRRVENATPDVVAYQVDLEAGVRLADGLRVSLEGIFASGDDPTTSDVEGWDELFPTTHKWLGLMDVIGIRTNVASGVAHASFVSGRFKALLDAHLFWRPETATTQRSYAGAEFNMQAIYILGHGMTIRGLYGAFVPGNDHFFNVGEGRFNADVAHYLEAQYTFRL